METIEEHEALFAAASLDVETVAHARIVGEWMPVAHVGIPNKIYVPTAGRGRLSLDRGSFELERGRAFFIPAGTRQQGLSLPEEPLEKHWLHFSAWTGEALQLLRFVDFPLCVEGAPAARVLELAARMLEEWHGKAPGRRLALRMLLCEMLLIAYRAPARCRPSADGPGLSTRERRSMDDRHLRIVRRVLTTLSNEYHEPLSLKVIAASFGWSQAHLSESFKELVGVPPQRFLESLRMRRAKELLAFSAEPVHRVAEMVGYVDPNYFSRAFVRSVGMTALEYRDAARLSQPAEAPRRKSRTRTKPVQ